MTYSPLESTDDLSVSVPTKINSGFRRARFLNPASKTADFTIFDDDTEGSIKDIYFVTTGSSTIAATLPPVADADPSNGRVVTVVKVDSGAGTVRVTGDGSETVDGAAYAALSSQYDPVTVVSNGTEWFTI